MSGLMVLPADTMDDAPCVARRALKLRGRMSQGRVRAFNPEGQHLTQRSGAETPDKPSMACPERIGSAPLAETMPIRPTQPPRFSPARAVRRSRRILRRAIGCRGPHSVGLVSCGHIAAVTRPRSHGV